MMFAILASTLFAAAGCLALGAIAVSWQRYGTAALALRQQLAACDTGREMRFVVMTTQLRCEIAQAWRPGFRPLATGRMAQPPLRPALHAAA